jgi:hypothetical protein
MRSITSRGKVAALAAGAAVTVITASPQMASAEKITFNTSNATVVNGDDLAFSGTSFDVVAAGYESTAFDPQDIFFGGDSAEVTVADATGLGVDGTGVLIFPDPDNQIDGFGINEFLSITFSQAVRLQEIDLGLLDGNDGIVIYVDGSLTPAFTATDLDAGDSPITLIPELAGTNFLFGVASSGLIDAGSNYSLLSVTAVVPMPGASLGGLALLGMMSLRRRPQA